MKEENEIEINDINNLKLRKEMAKKLMQKFLSSKKKEKRN